MQASYKPPTFVTSAFNCPHCGAYAKQNWYRLYYNVYGDYRQAETLHYSHCEHCAKLALWFREALIDPEVSGAPQPHELLPEEALGDYEEARAIAGRSPRSAAALLRLCVQKICNQLGDPKNTIDQNIALLVSRGLPVRVKKALDIVRVIGNEQVHPGTLDLRDNPEIVVELFILINFIVEDQIGRPAEIEKLYEMLPSTKKEGIEARDRKALETSTE